MHTPSAADRPRDFKRHGFASVQSLVEEHYGGTVRSPAPSVLVLVTVPSQSSLVTVGQSNGREFWILIVILKPANQYLGTISQSQVRTIRSSRIVIANLPVAGVTQFAQAIEGFWQFGTSSQQCCQMCEAAAAAATVETKERQGKAR